jgi:hypothetical protein
MGKSAKHFISLRVTSYVKETLDVSESHLVLVVEKDLPCVSYALSLRPGTHYPHVT